MPAPQDRLDASKAYDELVKLPVNSTAQLRFIHNNWSIIEYALKYMAGYG